MLKLLCMCKLVLFIVTGYWKIIIFTGASENILKSGEQLQYIYGSLFKPQLCSTTLNYCLFFESIGDQVYLVVFDINTKTVAWIANRDDPIANCTSNAALTLDSSGVLQITRDSGKPIPFYPPPRLRRPLFIVKKTFTATLRDSGNFVLQQHDYIDGSKSMLWQSFNLPTDVLLPGMKLGGDPKWGRMWSIVSYSHPNEPGSGPFSLEWNHYEKQLNILRNGKIYWASGELINNYTFEHIPENMYEYLIDEESITFKARKDKHYASWKLTSEGVLLDSAENVLAKANECRGYNDDNGCQNWDVPITCRNQTFEFDVVNATVKNAGNLNGSADLRVNFSTSDCKDACWRNCDCVGFTSLFDNGTGCYFVYKALDNIQPGSDIFYRLNIKTDSSHPKTPSDSKGNTKQHSRWKLIISFIIAISILCGCGCLLCIVRKRKKFALKVKEKGITTEHTIHHLNSYGFDYPNDSRGSIKHDRDLRLFSYASIVEATNGFSSLNELGKGGFGPVYKGILMGKEVAIKRLSRSSRQGVVEFKNEIMLESKLQHINLVQLLGCCIHEDERLLIYEYMPNKSLDFSLFDSTQRKLLDWKKRVNIIQGIAQGLLYLHKYSRLRIVHRDLKASNILLDKYMNPKISDFGMARIFMQESQEKTTRIVGTIGYMPPEYIINGIFSKMSDVYSFGVLMLEIVSGRRNNSFHSASNPINLVGHAWELWKEDQALKLLDPTLHDLVVQDEVLRYIHVALLCVEECPDDRPTMLEVSSMLSNANEKLPLHKRPAFYFSDENHPKIDSINDMSISDLSAR